MEQITYSVRFSVRLCQDCILIPLLIRIKIQSTILPVKSQKRDLLERKAASTFYEISFRRVASVRVYKEKQQVQCYQHSTTNKMRPFSICYMFQTGFPSIIKSSKLHIQRQVFVRTMLLPAAIPARLAAGYSNGLTNI